MFETYIAAHLADLTDSDLDKSLDAIVGTGASGVTLTVTSPPRMHLRCPENCAPRIFRSRGGYFFQPDLEHYAESHLKPVVSSWVRSRQPLAKAVTACRKRNLKIRLRISAFEVGRIVEKYPDAAAKSALGDVAPGTLCPANPDVRALLRGTLHDLVTRFAPDAVEITDLRYHSGALSHGGLAIGFDPGEGFLAVLSLCFSESSRQAAAERDIDTDSALRWAQVTLNKVLASGQPLSQPLAEVLRHADIPKRYVQCQRDLFDTQLVALIRGAGADVHLVLPGDDEDGVVPSAVSVKAAAGVVLEADVEDVDDVAANVAELRHRFGERTAITLDLDAGGETGSAAQELVSSVKAAADAGISAVSFSEWGLLPPGRLSVVKQAVRYASRSSG